MRVAPFSIFARIGCVSRPHVHHTIRRVLIHQQVFKCLCADLNCAVSSSVVDALSIDFVGHTRRLDTPIGGDLLGFIDLCEWRLFADVSLQLLRRKLVKRRRRTAMPIAAVHQIALVSMVVVIHHAALPCESTRVIVKERFVGGLLSLLYD